MSDQQLLSDLVNRDYSHIDDLLENGNLSTKAILQAIATVDDDYLFTLLHSLSKNEKYKGSLSKLFSAISTSTRNTAFGMSLRHQ